MIDKGERLVEIMSQIEEKQRQLGWVVDTETHNERLKHPISEHDVNQYVYQLAQLKDNLNTHGPAIRCHTCNDRGWVRSQNKDKIFNLFGGVNNPCSDCDKGREIKRERDEKNRKQKEAKEERLYQVKLVQAQESKWRDDLYVVCWIEVVRPIKEKVEIIPKLEREYGYLMDRVCKVHDWYMSEQYHLNGEAVIVSIPPLWEKDARLTWVKETVPFGLKAHEDFYVIESNLLLKIAIIQRRMQNLIYEILPAYTKSDESLEDYYKQLQEFVAQVLSDTTSDTDTDTNTNTE